MAGYDDFTNIPSGEEKYSSEQDFIDETGNSNDMEEEKEDDDDDEV